MDDVHLDSDLRTDPQATAGVRGSTDYTHVATDNRITYLERLKNMKSKADVWASGCSSPGSAANTELLYRSLLQSNELCRLLP